MVVCNPPSTMVELTTVIWSERLRDPTAVIDRLSTVKMGYWPPLIIIGYATYAPLSGVYECPWCSHGPRGPVGV